MKTTIDAMKQFLEAAEAFTDPEGNMPAATGEFNDLKACIPVLRKAIAREEAKTEYAAASKKHKEEGEEYMKSLRMFLPVIGVMSQMEEGHCMCPACKDGVIHLSDCAVHNEPAMPVGPCDCKREEAQTVIDKFVSSQESAGLTSDQIDELVFGEAQPVEPVAVVFNGHYQQRKELAEGVVHDLFTHPAPPPSGERAELIDDLRELVDRHTWAEDVVGRAANMLAADAQLSDQLYKRLDQIGDLKVAHAKELRELWLKKSAQQVAVPQGWELVDADKMREIIRDIRQHIQQGHLSEEVVAKQNPSYGTGIYTHLWHQMRKLSTLLAAAPQSPQAERVPMTDAEIAIISEAHWLYPRRFARAIEAHHRIKP